MKLPTLNALSKEALDIEAQLLETGELTPELEIRHDENKQQLAVKLDHYCYAIKSMRHKKEDLKDIKKQVDLAIEKIEKSESYLLLQIHNTADAHAFLANNFKFSYRKSQQVVVTEIDKLPPDLVRVKVEPDKVKIKERLKEGPIDGAILVDNETLGFKEKL